MFRFLFALLLFLASLAQLQAAKPNVIYIMADDLGWRDVGCYGQTKIRTPSIDKLAAEGAKLTNAYSGNAVCAPSRCCLMTGKHPGHAYIRDNGQWKPMQKWSGQNPLPEGTVTLPLLLKQAGYATGAMGKWGLGSHENSGDPKKLGIDYFFGYECQAHAHNHYPAYVFRNGVKVPLEGNDDKPTGKQFTQDLFEEEAIKFIKDHQKEPFFLYLPFIIPHVAIQVPDDSLNEYKGKFNDTPYTGKAYLPHEHPRAGLAGMITRMDRSIGRILDLLKELKLDENTLIVFTSDNGPVGLFGGSDNPYFESKGELRGWKGSLYEGGIKMPYLVRWPAKIKPGTTSTVISANWDSLPTICEAVGIDAPKDIDGISILPSLTGQGVQKEREYLYWEFPSYKGQQAVRMGHWKATRQNLITKLTDIELYDLAKDPNETTDVAKQHPEIVANIAAIMMKEHVPSEKFPLPWVDGPPKKK
jgi:arylsulfatase A